MTDKMSSDQIGAIGEVIGHMLGSLQWTAAFILATRALLADKRRLTPLKLAAKAREYADAIDAVMLDHEKPHLASIVLTAKRMAGVSVVDTADEGLQ